MQDAVRIFFDGGSRGNPGPAAGAAYTDWQDGHERVCFLNSATNNEAEYHGLLMAIQLAQDLRLPQVKFLGDSKLVVQQISGAWQTKHEKMQALRAHALVGLALIRHWSIEWVRREQNTEADRIANEEMDRQLGVIPLALDRDESTQPESGVRPAIQNLNRLGLKAGFTDFRQLKVGGRDEFSRASLATLQSILPNFDELNQAFTARLGADQLTRSLPLPSQAKLVLNALRWSARGLQGDLPLRKVLVDLEIAKNIIGKKT